MLSKTSRSLTYLLAALYLVLGALLFALPAQLAPLFAWKVSPFVTMTIGGWCIGNACVAWVTARRWDWKLVHPGLVYLWSFGLLQCAVLFVFRSKLALAHPLAWLYFITLCLTATAALVGIADWLRLRPARARFGIEPKPVHRFLATAFVVAVGGLGVYGLSVTMGGPGTNGGVFPELMSPFTLRSFGAFYLSLAIGTIPLITARSANAMLNHAFATFGLVFFITAAIFVYFDLFDFANKPWQMVYLGAYLVVGIPILYALRIGGTGLRSELARS